MREQGHCKLNLDEGSVWDPDLNAYGESPFLKFFDFETELDPEGHGTVHDVHKALEEKFADETKTEKEERLQIASARRRRNIVEINDDFELVRSDGTVIGHRDLAKLYRQKPEHLNSNRETQTEEQIIAQINNPRRKFQLMEMERRKNREAFEASGAKQQSVGKAAEDALFQDFSERKYKINLENWRNLQRSKQLAYN